MQEPSPHVVRSILHFHHVQLITSARIAEGGDHVTYAVNTDLIIRFGTQPRLTAQHQRERAVRDALIRTTSIPVAEILAVGEWQQGLSYMLERRLPGQSLERASLSPRGEDQLSQALRQLHAIGPLPNLDAIPDADPDRMISRALNAVQQLPDLGLSAEDITAQPFPANTDSPQLLHADFKGEHILVDDVGDLTGIIDWTDVAWGDVAWDIGGLAISTGARVARRIATGAGTPPQAIERGITIARLHTLHALNQRLHFERDAPLPLLYRQFERTWEQ